MYSTTNFILAGFVLLAHAPEGRNTWDTFEMMEALGVSKADYPNFFFSPKGRVCDVGLTVPGLALTFGKSEIFTQDASIMAWTGGYATAAAKDVAKFYFDLLGPEPKIVSEEARELMQRYNTMDMGFLAHKGIYGGGLMVLWFQNEHEIPNTYTNSSYVGHGGETYGFKSAQGFFKSLNASMSITVNNDFDSHVPYGTLCHIVHIVSAYKNVE
jgi:hypothetical protein